MVIVEYYSISANGYDLPFVSLSLRLPFTEILSSTTVLFNQYSETKQKSIRSQDNFRMFVFINEAHVRMYVTVVYPEPLDVKSMSAFKDAIGCDDSKMQLGPG